MRFRVLGGTELVADGTATSIGSERQRRLLAALAMRCPDTAHADWLVEAVWGAAPPSSSVKALRTVVSRLRSSLDACEQGAGQLVVARPPGYLLNVPAESVDANRFADLVTSGRRHLAEGDLGAARTELQEALGTWRGRPFVEFADDAWARAETVRLERLWVAAREADIEARLAAGLPGEVLGDVHRLVDDEPFSDGARALLVRALYADGRQTEALRAVQAYRELLAEEAGLEPGQELARLEQRVLANDPTLLPPTGRPLRGYRLHERLAATDRGAVYRGTQPGSERDVAIEVIGADVAGDADFVRSFELEGRALAQLGHAHVVPVYDCWREPGGAYLVRRLLSGGSLADPGVRARLGPDGLARVRSQISSALGVAHQAGLVHGPIEADDIQLDDHDTAFLANFRLGTGETTVDDDDRSFDRLFDALAVPSATADTPAAPPRVTNPYRGLAAFRESDVDVFFGRRRLIDATLDTLTRTGAVFVVGPSGSGKSSLVHAGLVPALAAGEIDGSDRWFVATMVPGADPFADLEAAVLRIAVHPPAGLLDQLRGPATPLARTIQRVLPEPDAGVVLVIDQFEELFTLTPEPERDRFLEALGGALANQSSPLRLVVTLRADFYDHPLARPQIARAVTEATVAVDMLAGDELRAAIVEPSRVVGVDIEPALAGRLVADASRAPGTLPMLQYALTRLFDERTHQGMTLDAYLAMGGLAAAIGARAEDIYDALDDDQSHACRRLFGRLVTAEVATDTRRRARLAELRAAEDDLTDLDPVIDRFVEARLLLTDRDPTTREPTLEVAHEALFREWPRLATWIRDDRETIATLRHLTGAAQSWNTSGDEGDLYRGARLVAALDLVADHPERLTPDEHDFVATSRDVADRERRHQQQTNRRLRALLVTTGLFLVASIVAGLVANSQRNRADERAAEAREQANLAAESATRAEQAAASEAEARAAADQERLMTLARSTGAAPREVAILAGLEAHRSDPSPDTLNALHASLTADPGFRGTIGGTAVGGDITVLDDGERVVVHTSDTIEVWDITERERTHAWPFPGAAEALSLGELRSTAAGDGTLLVATTPGVTTVIHTETGRAEITVEHGSAAVGVALSPDATQLAIALTDGTVEIRRLDDPSEPVATRNIDGAAPSLTWHPDSRRLALGTTNGLIVVWEPDRGEDSWRLRGTPTTDFLSERRAPQLLLSSDGARLIVAGLERPEADAPGIADPVLLELATDTGGRLGTISITDDTTLSLGWSSPDEIAVVAFGREGFAETVDLEIDAVVASSPALATRIAVLPDLGLSLASTSAGLALRSIDESNPLVQRVPLPPLRDDLPFVDIILSAPDPTGERLLAGAPYHPAHIIDLDHRHESWQPFTSPDGEPVHYAGAAAGDRVYTNRGSGALSAAMRDWTGNLLTEWLETGLPPLAYSTVSPTGDRILFAFEGEYVLFELDPESRQIARLEPSLEDLAASSLRPAVFSTDGALVSRPDLEGGTDLFDAATGEPIAFDHEMKGELFGPRGTWFATTDSNGTIHLRDQRTGDPIGEPLVGHSSPIFWLLPTLDGQRLATIGLDETARVWDLEAMTQIGRAFDASPFGTSAWSADGNHLSVAVRDGNRVSHLEVWNFDTDTWPEIACELVGRNMTEAEWDQFGPSSIDRRATCPQYRL